MKILHLYSDWKWTGPIEPVLQMCKSLQDLGHQVLLAHCTADNPDERENIARKAVEYGVQGTEMFALDRYIHPWATVKDLFSLPRFLKREKFDVMHMHLCHDHAFGGLCARILRRQNRPLLVRTLHRRDVLKQTFLYRLQLRKCTDAWLTFTDSFKDEYVRRFNLPEDSVGVQPLTIDLERFNPHRKLRDMRSEFGIAAAAPLIGIVGRYQRYRKMDLFLTAASLLLRQIPEARFMVIGNSSKMQETVVKPCTELGIADKVILPGYRIEDYDDIIGALDIFTLLMPGFDGTARAVREAMAMAKPCVVSDFGMLPEIIQHERGGLAVPMEPEALVDGWLKLLRNPHELEKMGGEARKIAEEKFRMEAVGPFLEGFYRKMLSKNQIRHE